MMTIATQDIHVECNGYRAKDGEAATNGIDGISRVGQCLVLHCFRRHLLSGRSLKRFIDGVLYAQIIDQLLPGTILLPMIHQNDSTFLGDQIKNYKLIKIALMKAGCDIDLNVRNLVNYHIDDHIDLILHLGHLNYSWYCELHIASQENCRCFDLLSNHLSDIRTKFANLASKESAMTTEINSSQRPTIDEDGYEFNLTLVNHEWCNKILSLVHKKASILEGFVYLSAIGGGFSALGEANNKFSLKAGLLSLGKQMRLAELLNDERLMIMCHLYAVMAAIQLKSDYAFDYYTRVVSPMMAALPYRDPVLKNVWQHVMFRLKIFHCQKTVEGMVRRGLVPETRYSAKKVNAPRGLARVFINMLKQTGVRFSRANNRIAQ